MSGCSGNMRKADRALEVRVDGSNGRQLCCRVHVVEYLYQRLPKYISVAQLCAISTEILLLRIFVDGVACTYAAASASPLCSKYGTACPIARASCPWVVPSTPSMPGHIKRFDTTALGPLLTTALRTAGEDCRFPPLYFCSRTPWPSSVFFTSQPGR